MAARKHIFVCDEHDTPIRIVSWSALEFDSLKRLHLETHDSEHEPEKKPRQTKRLQEDSPDKEES